jgi:hypothetical protein
MGTKRTNKRVGLKQKSSVIEGDLLAEECTRVNKDFK